MVAEKVVLGSEHWFQALVEHNGDIIAVLNAQHKLLYRSPSAYRITGYTNEEIDSMRNIDNMHPEDQGVVMAALDNAMAHPGTQVPLRYRGRHKNGHWLVMEGTLTNLLDDPAVQGIVFNFRDITAQFMQQQQLLEAEQQMEKKIKQALLQGQEKERNAIGLELHDNVNQLLAATSLLLAVLQTNPGKTAEILPSCLAQIKMAIEENRRIAHEFSSPGMTDSGLVLQLERLGYTMLEPAGISSKVSAEGFNEASLDCEQKINLYRIAQEQCSNIVKHAHAASTTMTLHNRDNKIVLCIADDGVGMDCRQKITGIGLNNIRTRLGIFDGFLNIDTAPGQGFALQITMPVA